LRQNPFDGHTLALEAATGRILWDVTIADPAKGESLAAASLMAEGRVVSAMAAMISVSVAGLPSSMRRPGT
jgi:outer membrane protein assembly factor BamB